VDDADWKRLAGQLSRGDCTPFIGAGACSETLPSAVELSRDIAKNFSYPFMDNRDNLASVSQFAARMTGDPVDFKMEVCERLRRYGYPDAKNPAEPHTALASYPLPIYVTTNYDDFMASALIAASREPRTEICPWTGPDLRQRTGQLDGERPTATRPLVYHLHGSCNEPETLVLTENDYLEFVHNLAQDQRNAYRLILPSQIYAAIARKPLLFVGYSLHDWTFRAIFHGLFRATASVQWRRHVSIQLLPPLIDNSVGTRQRAEEFLMQEFADWKISIYWGTAVDFFEELFRRGGGS
jgi:hypothetical protein